MGTFLLAIVVGWFVCVDFDGTSLSLVMRCGIRCLVAVTGELYINLVYIRLMSDYPFGRVILCMMLHEIVHKCNLCAKM